MLTQLFAGGERRRGLFCAAFALAALLFAALASSALARYAYVANNDSNNVSVFDTATNQVVGAPITVGPGPFGIAITPDGARAYVVNDGSNSVSVIDTQTNTVLGAPITVGPNPYGIAITPDGARAYVTNPNTGSDNVSVIDTATNAVVGAPITVGSNPSAVAITPDGSRAYVTNAGSNNVSVIDTATNQVVGTPITVGTGPNGIAITPNGARAYVANYNSNTVSVIDTATNQVMGAPITVGSFPFGMAITPDGTRAYVTNDGSNSVSVIDTATNQVAGAPITVSFPDGLGITPDGQRAYVANDTSPGSVSVIDTQTNQTVGAPISVGMGPGGIIAITPDQPPHASFTDPSARGKAVSFNAKASSDPDGTIARYDWAFGDGKKALTAGPRVRHRYRAPGRYKVTLALTDNEGCSTHFVFSGQTASCNGSALASQTQALIEVSLRCPTSAKPVGCKFKLEALTNKRKGKAETALTKAKLKAGRSTLVSLKPKRAFGGKLLTARKVLVKETVTIKGQKRTLYRRLKSRGT